MIITDQPVPKALEGGKRCKAVLAINGGAGGTLPPHIPPKLDRAHRDALRRSLVRGYEVLSAGGSALDAVCRSVQEMEDDPLFNAAKGAVFTKDGTIECEASVMVANRLSLDARRCASAVLIRRTKNPILLAKTLLQDPQSNPHVILSGEIAEAIGWKNGLEKVDSSYYRTRRRWLEHRRDLGLPDDDVADPPSYTAQKICTPSLSRDDTSDEKDETTDADTPSDQSLQEEDLGVHHFIQENINIDGRSSDQGGSDVASPGSASFESLPLAESSTSLRRATTISIDSLPAGTVGAVAIDENGNLAVATSTGGITNKLPGRIGDTPVPGAGFYAEYWTQPQDMQMFRMRAVEKSDSFFSWSPSDSIRWMFCAASEEEKDEEGAIDQESEKGDSMRRGVAISGTGTGDFFLRTSFASLLAHRMRFLGEDVDTAGCKAVKELGQAGGVGGAICIDEGGRGELFKNVQSEAHIDKKLQLPFQ